MKALPLQSWWPYTALTMFDALPKRREVVLV